MVKAEGDNIHHALKIIFTGSISEKQEKYIEDEISEIKWFSPEEIQNMDLLAGRKYPLDLLTHTEQK